MPPGARPLGPEWRLSRRLAPWGCHCTLQPLARPLAHAQLAVAAGRLPAGSVWGDAGHRVAASRTPELPLLDTSPLDTSPQDRCVDRGPPSCGLFSGDRVRNLIQVSGSIPF